MAKREPRQRKGESWREYCKRHEKWYNEYWTPERKAANHEVGVAWQKSRQQLAQSAAGAQDRAWTQHEQEIAAGELCIIELPLSPGSLGRGGRLTRYIYCSPAGRQMLIDRMQGRERVPQRPADRCMHGRPHNCFYPTGGPHWCYVTATPPAIPTTPAACPILPGLEEMFTLAPAPITQRLCCPQAARLLVRELHARGWTDIELSTTSPEREVTQFVRYMQATMPCLNR